MKEFLSREGVAFVTKNVDEDDAAYEEMMQRGWRTIPVTVIGETAVGGYDPEAIRSALRQQGRVSPGSQSSPDR